VERATIPLYGAECIPSLLPLSIISLGNLQNEYRVLEVDQA